jgi:hypothetical protein
VITLTNRYVTTKDLVTSDTMYLRAEIPIYELCARLDYTHPSGILGRRQPGCVPYKYLICGMDGYKQQLGTIRDVMPRSSATLHEFMAHLKPFGVQPIQCLFCGHPYTPPFLRCWQPCRVETTFSLNDEVCGVLNLTAVLDNAPTRPHTPASLNRDSMAKKKTPKAGQRSSPRKTQVRARTRITTHTHADHVGWFCGRLVDCLLCNSRLFTVDSTSTRQTR